jgi:hypothetical protein
VRPKSGRFENEEMTCGSPAGSSNGTGKEVGCELVRSCVLDPAADRREVKQLARDTVAALAEDYLKRHARKLSVASRRTSGF